MKELAPAPSGETGAFSGLLRSERPQTAPLRGTRCGTVGLEKWHSFDSDLKELVQLKSGHLHHSLHQQAGDGPPFPVVGYGRSLRMRQGVPEPALVFRARNPAPRGGYSELCGRTQKFHGR